MAFRADEPVIEALILRESEACIGLTGVVAGNEVPVSKHVLHQPAPRADQQLTVIHKDAKAAGLLRDRRKLASEGR